MLQFNKPHKCDYQPQFTVFNYNITARFVILPSFYFKQAPKLKHKPCNMNFNTCNMIFHNTERAQNIIMLPKIN